MNSYGNPLLQQYYNLPSVSKAWNEESKISKMGGLLHTDEYYDRGGGRVTHIDSEPTSNKYSDNNSGGGGSTGGGDDLCCECGAYTLCGGLCLSAPAWLDCGNLFECVCNIFECCCC